MAKFAVALPLGPPEAAGKLLQDQLKFGNDWNAELSRAMPAVPAHIEREERQARDGQKKPFTRKHAEERQYPEARKRWSDRRPEDRPEEGRGNQAKKADPRKSRSEKPRQEKSRQENFRQENFRPEKSRPEKSRSEKFKSEKPRQEKLQGGKPGRFDKPVRIDDEARKLAARIDGTLKLGRIVKSDNKDSADKRPAKPKRQGPRNAGKQKPKRDANRFR